MTQHKLHFDANVMICEKVHAGILYEYIQVCNLVVMMHPVRVCAIGNSGSDDVPTKVTLTLSAVVRFFYAYSLLCYPIYKG